ncbi:MAG: hypothetical protein WB565_07230 [Acidimicrobiales bacterium]
MGEEVRSLIDRLRARRRASPGWKLAHANPLGLTRSEYLAAEAAQARIFAEVMRVEDAPGIVEELRARAEQARRWHYAAQPPSLTRDQQASLLAAEARTSSGTDNVRRRRVVY